MYLQPEEIRALFACIDSRRDRAIFRVAYHHGLRAHEKARDSSEARLG
jgi:integrase